MTLLDKLNDAAEREVEGEIHKLLRDAVNMLTDFYASAHFIANDYVELSHDKVMWQRNDHMKRCAKIIELYHQYDDEEDYVEPKPLEDDF